MRVIAGKARGTKLEVKQGGETYETRPTLERLKENIFNILTNNLYDANFLDVFAGSGSIGIEALSRNAKFCTFIEKDKQAIDIINKNLDKTKLNNLAEVLYMDFLQALKKLNNTNIVYDIIFCDPPYQKNFTQEFLKFLYENELKFIDKNTILILEIGTTELDSIVKLIEVQNKFQIYKKNIYTTSSFLFLELK